MCRWKIRPFICFPWHRNLAQSELRNAGSLWPSLAHVQLGLSNPCDLAQSIFGINGSWDDFTCLTKSLSQRGIGPILILIRGEKRRSDEKLRGMHGSARVRAGWTGWIARELSRSVGVSSTSCLDDIPGPTGCKLRGGGVRMSPSVRAEHAAGRVQLWRDAVYIYNTYLIYVHMYVYVCV